MSIRKVGLWEVNRYGTDYSRNIAFSAILLLRNGCWCWWRWEKMRRRQTEMVLNVGDAWAAAAAQSHGVTDCGSGWAIVAGQRLEFDVWLETSSLHCRLQTVSPPPYTPTCVRSLTENRPPNQNSGVSVTAFTQENYRPITLFCSILLGQYFCQLNTVVLLSSS